MPLERAIGRAILRGLAPEPLSVNTIINIARRAGGGYRREIMVEDLRKFRGRLKYQTQVMSLTSNQVVPRSWMNETDLKFPANYRVFFDTEFYDEDTGESWVETSSIFTDDLKKVGDWENDFVETFSGTYKEMGMEITGIKVKWVEHFEGRAY